MILTSQMTKDYFDKAQPLFDSIKKYWNDRFVLGCIDFDPADTYRGEYFMVEKEEIPSYRPDYPKNRKGFVTMQCGDFAKYIDCPDDEIIICIDADTVLQRELSYDEMDQIEYILDENDLLSVYGANPPIKLRDVLDNIGCKLSDYSLKELYGEGWKDNQEFTTSILIARKKFFIKLADKYNEQFWKLPLTTDHHAGCQWLFNWVCSKYKFVEMYHWIQCGAWYNTFDTKTIDGELYFENKKVLFNHTKFNV